MPYPAKAKKVRPTLPSSPSRPLTGITSAPTGTEEPKLASIRMVRISSLKATSTTSDLPTALTPPMFSAPSSRMAILEKRPVVNTVTDSSGRNRREAYAPKDLATRATVMTSVPR